jgi:hypothetical protein
VLFTTDGCLGQIGMNAHGVAIGINNLTAADGRMGVTWPLVVRRALAATTPEEALAAILDADLAGGHAFLLVGPDGTGFQVEAMPTCAAVTRLDADVLVHSNHTLDAATTARQAKKPADLVASSHARLDRGRSLLAAGDVDLLRLQSWTADPALCRHPEPPHHLETSGAVVMHPPSRSLWCCWGPPDGAVWEHIEVPIRPRSRPS